MTPLKNSQYWLTNILLADALAKHSRHNRAAAIKRCARKMRDDATEKKTHKLAKMILKAPDERVVAMAAGLLVEMQKDGLVD